MRRTTPSSATARKQSSQLAARDLFHFTPLTCLPQLVPGTHTHPCRPFALGARLSHTGPITVQAETFLPGTYAGIRGCAAEYRDRPDPPIRTDPWDDLTPASRLYRYPL